MAGDLGIVVMVALLASPFVLYIGVRLWFASRQMRREQLERYESNRVEAEEYFERVGEAGGAETVETNLILGGDEHAVLADEATLYETRATRVYGGGGTSIKGVHARAGASESVSRLRRIDGGTLVLTTRRLIFDGRTENRSLKLTDVLSVEPLLEAIEVSTQRRGKSMLLAVPNPLIWAPMVKAVAAKAKAKA